MPIDSLDIVIRAVVSTPEGCAVFLGNAKKVFMIAVDPGIGQALTLAINAAKKERPLTHDLMLNTFAGFGISFERMVINDAIGGTFYARIIFRLENELGVKLVEVDARPSDAMVLATNAKKPIAVSVKLWETVEDSSALMKKLLSGRN